MSKTTKTKTDASKATETQAPATVSLADLSRARGKNPKAVRSRFRKLYNQDGTPRNPEKYPDLPRPVKGGSRWTFAASDTDKLNTMIGEVDDGE